MKFSSITKHQIIQYRICDEVTCKSMALRVTIPAAGSSDIEHHLCESHYMKYKAELKDAKSIQQ